MRNRRPSLIPLAALVPVALAAAGCGGGGSGHGSSHGATAADQAGPAARTVEIEMRDIAYSVPSVPVKAGETVKFVFHNAGKTVHEAFIGDEAAQAEHDKKMMDGGMTANAGSHEEGDEILVDPGKTGNLTHTFATAGPVFIGCHEPGHYQAGMKIAVLVG